MTPQMLVMTMTVETPLLTTTILNTRSSGSSIVLNNKRPKMRLQLSSKSRKTILEPLQASLSTVVQTLPQQILTATKNLPTQTSRLITRLRRPLLWRKGSFLAKESKENTQMKPRNNKTPKDLNLKKANPILRIKFLREISKVSSPNSIKTSRVLLPIVLKREKQRLVINLIGPQIFQMFPLISLMSSNHISVHPKSELPPKHQSKIRHSLQRIKFLRKVIS
jgi:hypothetical protein